MSGDSSESMSFKKLGALLPQQLRRSGIARQVLAAQVLDVANDVIDAVFGQGTSQNQARAVSLKQGTLEIASIQSVFRQEIQRNSTMLQQRVNDQLGEDLVKKVRAVI